MTIEIVNNPNKTITGETLAADELKEMLVNSIPSDVSGKLFIASNLTLSGQEVRDIDLAVWGNFSNYKLTKYYTNDPQYAKKDLMVDSFFMVIELKEIGIDGLSYDDTHIWSGYEDCCKDVTHQNEKQRYSMKKFLKSTCKLNIYVTNAIWLKDIDRKELVELTCGIPIGAFPDNFGLKEIIDITILQGQKPWYDRDNKYYVLSSGDDAKNFDYIKQKLFVERRIASKLTRRRLELLTQRNAENIVFNKVLNNELTTLSGKAGTGKTFILLQAAYQLVNNDKNVSCIILTYNLALVSDIRRLVHYLFPDNIGEDKIQITSLHKFFMRMMDIYKISTRAINGNAFDIEYRNKLRELYEYVDAMDEKDTNELKKGIGWDYVLIDEAQDWDPIERDILVKVYGAKRLIIADGGQQFIRSNNHLDWGGKEVPLELGRRQKSSLVKFLNLLAEEMGMSWTQKNDKDLKGGKVRIIKNYEDIHPQITSYCQDQDCENYDILFLVPPQMVEHENNHSYFCKLQDWKEKDIVVFDGTDERKRDEYPSKAEECRLFQYESCRGLEGWVVVCMQFDKLIEFKKNHFDPNKHAEKSLAFESNKEKMKRYLWMWTMLPFTRAIDTLIITLEDPNSEIGQLLKRVADANQDFVHWEIVE